MLVCRWQVMASAMLVCAPSQLGQCLHWYMHVYMHAAKLALWPVTDCGHSCCNSLSHRSHSMTSLLLQAELDFVTPPWPKISAAAKDCVRQLLNTKVTARPTASELLQVIPYACMA